MDFVKRIKIIETRLVYKRDKIIIKRCIWDLWNFLNLELVNGTDGANFSWRFVLTPITLLFPEMWVTKKILTLANPQKLFY